MTRLAETIAAQGELLAGVLEVEIDDAAAVLAAARRVHVVGTGTSQHAAELGARMLAAPGREVRWFSSASFEVPLAREDAVVVISHTAETPFAQRARRRALDAGAGVVTITGRDRGWPEAIETVPAETSETYTGSYLAALLVLARLGVATGAPAVDSRRVAELPQIVAEAARGPALLDVAPERLVVLAGTGAGAVTAREGALKLREGARLPAEGYEAEYLLHGSAVCLGAGDALIALAAEHDASGLLGELAGAAGAEGLTVVTVPAPAGLDPLLAQFPLTVALQLTASHLADAAGLDPDLVITGAWAGETLWSAGAPPATA